MVNMNVVPQIADLITISNFAALFENCKAVDRASD